MSQKNDYKVVYSSNNDIKISYYFHSDNKEYARVYGNSIKSDSLAFVQNKNDLIVNEFKYNDKEKKRLPTGNIKYINYYTKLSDIIASENAFSIDEVPVNNLKILLRKIVNNQKLDLIIVILYFHQIMNFPIGRVAQL